MIRTRYDYLQRNQLKKGGYQSDAGHALIADAGDSWNYGWKRSTPQALEVVEIGGKADVGPRVR